MGFLLSAVDVTKSNVIVDIFQFLKQEISQFTVGDYIRNIIDILLITFVLYVAIRFLWDRRAGKLLLGLTIWMIALLLSRIFRLYAFGSILEALTQAGVVVLAVIFQPELRDALETIGGVPFKNIKNLSSDTKSEQVVEGINAICEAATDMARTKTGALIVIERSTKLGDIIRSGVNVDAKLSPYMLRSIFFVNSPLHDGAVVIRNMRICSAGCLLPLTRRQDIDPNLGTRHRAALGMSESCDAVIVVVSEETGTISVAYNRTLTRDYTSQTLKLRLSEILLSSAETGGISEEEKSDENE